MKLLKHADVYAPAHLGLKDVLIEGERIVRIADSIDGYEDAPDVELLDLGGKRLVPGYIDLHVHLTGGGGEQGPASRTPEASLGELLSCGVTTAIGMLGTDGISRSLENLLAKARALNEEGITCYLLTGSYAYPPVTLTGSVERDIALIDLVIGVKTALSDHRSSHPRAEALIALGGAARRAGLLSSCCGLVTIHMGSGKGRLDPVFQALEQSDLPAKNLLPTHMNLRDRGLVDDGIRLTKLGGNMDMTALGTRADNEQLAETIRYCLEQGAPLESLTVSTDAYGSQPRFNQAGECVGLTYSTSAGLHLLVQALVSQGLPLERALLPVTANPARVLDLVGRKGVIAPGGDADFLVYDSEFAIDSVIAKGRLAIWNKERLLKGRFES